MNDPRIVKSLAAVAMLLLSAFVGAEASRWVARAHPRVELAAVRFDGAMDSDQNLRLSPELRGLYEVIPFVFEELHQVPTLSDWNEVIAAVGDHSSNLAIAREAVAEIKTLLTDRRQDYPKQDLRRELLTIWLHPPGDALDKTMRGVLAQHGYLMRFRSEDSLRKYLIHPDEWKDPTTARVTISPTRGYALSEIPELYDDDDQTKRLKHELNTVRRLWIHLDRDLLQEIMAHVDEELAAIITQAEVFSDALRGEREVRNPTRIHVRAVVSNMGDRAMVLRGVGFLQLRTSRRSIPVELAARVDGLLSPTVPIVIPGNSSTVVDYYSSKTLETLEAEHFQHSTAADGTASPLRALYNTEAIDATLTLAKLLDDGTPDVLVARQAAVFGLSAETDLVTALRSKLE